MVGSGRDNSNLAGVNGSFEGCVYSLIKGFSHEILGTCQLTDSYNVGGWFRNPARKPVEGTVVEIP